MKADNKWHEGVVIEDDDIYRFFDTLADAQKWCEDHDKKQLKYQPVRFNWNGGEPVYHWDTIIPSIKDMTEHILKQGRG